MAKCDLSIELDHPNKVYSGGEKITGTIHVDVDADVRCKGLEVQSNWRTHGRGNVTKATTESVTVFSGEWMAGQRESYPFEVIAADWPPSYHGHYINVDHYVDVRAKIPWAFDPKASREVTVRPLAAPDDKINPATEISGCVGNVIGVFIVGAILAAMGGFIVALFQNILFAIIVGAIVVPIIFFCLARYLLPKWLLGNVECELITPVVAPGETVKAKLAFRPKRTTQINSISAKLTGTEVCYSGSGSNRTRHNHQFYEERHELQGTAKLDPGIQKEFNVEFTIPDDVPYSFQVSDNSLTWNIEMRVDIPRWPDWTKALGLQIFPNGTDSPPAGTEKTQQTIGTPTSQSLSAQSEDSDITFTETASHLWQLRDDPDQVDILVEAVLGMTFDIDTFIERRLLYSGDEDPHVYEDGYAVWARHREPPLPLVLYIPHNLGDEFEQAGRDLWTFRGTIVGWDHEHRRLQIKVLPN